MTSHSPATPVCPRTRSESSREGLGYDSDKPDLSFASADFDVFEDPSSSFVQGTLLRAEILFRLQVCKGTESQFPFDDVVRRNLLQPIPQSHTDDCVFVGISSPLTAAYLNQFYNS